MFKNPFVIEHRRVAVQAQEYALSLALTETDKSVVAILGVEPHEFVAERQLYLAGVIRSSFTYFEGKTGKKEIRLALVAFDQNIDAHFAAVPGLTAEWRAKMDYKIRQTYQVTPNPPDLYARFLIEVTAGKFGIDDLAKFPGFAQLMEQYMEGAMRFVYEKIARLN